ncbi:MAG: 50S ribosomal protein L24 [Gammaproteobacteria bacterium WSBS_2016_MAG_OTU1]
MNKIKRGDEVIILCGQNKGQRGVVQRVFLDSIGKPERVLVEGMNMATNYDRPNPQQNQPGGLIKREAPIHASNVSLVNAESGKPMRVKIGESKKGNERLMSSGESS